MAHAAHRMQQERDELLGGEQDSKVIILSKYFQLLHLQKKGKKHEVQPVAQIQRPF